MIEYNFHIAKNKCRGEEYVVFFRAIRKKHSDKERRILQIGINRRTDWKSNKNNFDSCDGDYRI